LRVQRLLRSLLSFAVSAKTGLNVDKLMRTVIRLSGHARRSHHKVEEPRAPEAAALAVPPSSVPPSVEASHRTLAVPGRGREVSLSTDSASAHPHLVAAESARELG
jgi:hypothetical protein